MKTNLSIINIIVAVSVIILTGCKKPIEEEVNPMCEYWAPEDCTFSLDKYNSPAELCDYFMEHDSTRLSHNGDTVKIWGWVYYHGPEEPRLTPLDTATQLESWSADAYHIFLVKNENHHGYDEIWGIHWTSTFMQDHPEFVQNFDSLLPKKWYVTARVYCFPEYCPGPCTQIGMHFYAIDIDTIPK